MKTIFKIFLILCIIPLASCKKNPGSANWDIHVISPLINASLGIDNILADSLIQVNSDSSLEIVYHTSLYDFSVDSLVNIPDTITRQVFHIPVNVTAQPGQLILNTTDNKKLDFGNAQVTRIDVKSGYINLKTRNTLKEKLLCTYQIPCAKKNGNIFTETDLLPAADNSGPSSFSKMVDISGYSIDLTGPTGISDNILTSVTKAWVDSNGSPVNITYLDSMIFLANFEDLVVDYAKGFFGTQQFQSGQQSSAFDLFKKITDGSLSLENLHLVLTVKNGFGVDASLMIHEIKSVNNHSGNIVSLNSSLIGSVIHVNRAQETFNPSDPVIPSSAIFNLDNSNFKQLIENLPDQLGYSLDITTDPLGNISSGNDFVYNGHGFNADLDLEIPLSLMANNLTLTDTVSFNLSKPSGYGINHGTLTLLADNGFPFSASAQIFILDDSGMKTDSLIAYSNTIASAPLDASNKVIVKKRSAIIIPVSGSRLDHLYNAKKLMVVVRFNTANQPQYIKIYSDYKLDLKLTGDFDMTVNDN